MGGCLAQECNYRGIGRAAYTENTLGAIRWAGLLFQRSFLFPVRFVFRRQKMNARKSKWPSETVSAQTDTNCLQYNVTAQLKMALGTLQQTIDFWMCPGRSQKCHCVQFSKAWLAKLDLYHIGNGTETPQSPAHNTPQHYNYTCKFSFFSVMLLCLSLLTVGQVKQIPYFIIGIILSVPLRCTSFC